jgi:hypothetical protein
VSAGSTPRSTSSTTSAPAAGHAPQAAVHVGRSNKATRGPLEAEGRMDLAVGGHRGREGQRLVGPPRRRRGAARARRPAACARRGPGARRAWDGFPPPPASRCCSGSSAPRRTTPGERRIETIVERGGPGATRSRVSREAVTRSRCPRGCRPARSGSTRTCEPGDRQRGDGVGPPPPEQGVEPQPDEHDGGEPRAQLGLARLGHHRLGPERRPEPLLRAGEQRHHDHRRGRDRDADEADVGFRRATSCAIASR